MHLIVQWPTARIHQVEMIENIPVMLIFLVIWGCLEEETNKFLDEIDAAIKSTLKP
jgi:hypothetical protein